MSYVVLAVVFASPKKEQQEKKKHKHVDKIKITMKSKKSPSQVEDI